MVSLRAPCETAVKYILPSVRSIVANHLYKRHGFSQLEIARLMGVSQSTVSRYVNNERGLYAQAVEKIPGLEQKLEEITRYITNGVAREQENREQEKPLICILCEYIRQKSPDFFKQAKFYTS